MNQNHLHKYDTKELSKKGLIDYKRYKPKVLVRYGNQILEILRILSRNRLVLYSAPSELVQIVNQRDVTPLTSQYIDKLKKETEQKIIRKSVLDTQQKRREFTYTLLGKILKKNLPPERYDLSMAGGEIQLTIHYPDLVLTNSAEQTHPIKDMFVRFIFVYYKFPITLNNIYFCRTTATRKDFYVDGGRINTYTHSHLPKRHFGAWTDGFCFGGNTIIGKTVYKYSQEFDFQTFSSFLLNLENVLKWESLEGGPYTRLSQLKGGGNLSAPSPAFTNQFLHEIYLRTLKKLRDLNKFPALRLENGEIAIPYKKKLHTIITEASDEYDTTNSITPFPKYPFDESSQLSYMPANHRTLEAMREIDGKKSEVTFKGEKIPIKVIFEEEAQKESEKLLVHHILYNQVVAKIGTELEQSLIINMEENAE